MKNCAKCGDPLKNKRAKFCSDSCKYWFNVIKKEKEKGLPPVKKRNKNYFLMVTGSTRATGATQGRRNGGMITGGMSAMVFVTVEEVVEFNKENVIRHFKGIPGYQPTYLTLGDGTRIQKDEAFSLV